MIKSAILERQAVEAGEMTTEKDPVCRREDNVLLVPENGVFPPFCVTCGMPAPQNATYSCSETIAEAWLSLLFFPLLPAALACLLMRRRLRMTVPLCELHKRRFNRFGIASIALLLAAAPIGVMTEFVLLPNVLRGWGVPIVVGIALVVASPTLLWIRRGSGRA